jgi:tRNA pseudouridine38-40 synthase
MVPPGVAMRIRMGVEYDGTDFAGWQRQTRRRSVQATLEAAIASVTGDRDIVVVGAGRTDAGVHATGQVAHFDTSWLRPPEVLGRALNAVLPPDVAVHGVMRVPTHFHARYSALARRYRYSVWMAPVRSPLLRRSTVHAPRPLAPEPMRRAAALLLGEHDFGGFGSPSSPGGATVRRLDRLEIAAEGARLTFDLEANAFLRHQVRRTVGLLLDIGWGRLDVEAVQRVLERSPGAPVARRAPARGLLLVAVRYPPMETCVDSVHEATTTGSES